jgi:hypothetical protein
MSPAQSLEVSANQTAATCRDKSGETIQRAIVFMKIFNADHSELMEVVALKRDGKNLVISGNIMGSLPIRCILTPTEARSAFKLMSGRLMFFILSMLLRS